MHILVFKRRILNRAIPSRVCQSQFVPQKLSPLRGSGSSTASASDWSPEEILTLNVCLA